MAKHVGYAYAMDLNYEQLARMSQQEIEWKKSWNEKANQKFPFINTILWDNVNMDVTVSVKIADLEEPDVKLMELEQWLTQEATEHLFCYTIELITTLGYEKKLIE